MEVCYLSEQVGHGKEGVPYHAEGDGNYQANRSYYGDSETVRGEIVLTLLI